MHAHADARRPAWIDDRHDRLAALAARARGLARALSRERCDIPRSDADRRAALSDRIAANERRFRLLASCARVARRSHKNARVGT